MTTITKSSLEDWQQVMFQQLFDVYSPLGGNSMAQYTRQYQTPGLKAAKAEVDESDPLGVLPSGSRRDLTEVHLPEVFNQVITVNWYLQDVTGGASTYGELWIVRGRPLANAHTLDKLLGECVARVDAAVKAPPGVPELRS